MTMVNPITTSAPFGTLFTDYMFVMEWDIANGWHNERIQSYQDFKLNPASANLHYGQEIFEGMKAFKTVNHTITIFRPNEHLERMNRSAKIMCMPTIDTKKTLHWLKQLILKDQDWIPNQHGTALYIRPTMIAVDHALYLKPSSHYMFFIILSPVGALYSQGFNPVSIMVSQQYTRASRGGVGQAKAAGNYGASMRAQHEAQKAGCSQVLWLDPIERKNIEEVGAMNIFFVINGMVVTPALTDSILAGITRASIIELCNQHSIPLQERTISIQEIITGIQDGSVQEAFGCGTAAVVSPVGSLRYNDAVYTINNNQTGPVAQQFFKLLTDIQYGVSSDVMQWLEII